jgi:hypothetical protein
MLDKIKADLAAHIDARIVNEILEHHNALKTSFRLQDWEKCLVRGGKFVEAVMKAIHFIRTGKVTKQISVSLEIEEASKQSDLPEPLRLLIPRATRVLYDHRSKRGGAHGSFDPNVMDCTLVVAISDWVLSELVRMYCVANPDLAMKFAIGTSSKSIPIIESIAGDYIVLKKGASARQEIGLILYSRYPERTTRDQLRKWIPNHSPANISLSLGNMRKAKLVHLNPDGAMLTKAGVEAVEKEIKPNSEP